jgi:transglutaminase-like putative cysteine protease
MVAVREGPKAGRWCRAICDFVHDRIAFGYAHASPTRTAFDAYTERRGACRGFAHLAVTLCRCMNIPARYCTGYLGDIGVPPDPSRWISAPGSRSISATAGTRSTPATTSRASGASDGAVATPRRRAS